MLSSSEDLVAVLDHGVEVGDVGLELDLHVAQEEGGAGGADLAHGSEH